MQVVFICAVIICMTKAVASRSKSPRPALARDNVVSLDQGPTQTLKPFAFLEAIAEVQRPLSVSELSALLAVPQPTAHRIVHMLESEGFLERDVGTRKFAPGPRLLQLGLGVVSTAARLAPRRAILESLSQEIGETCNFGVRAGNRIIYLDRVEAKWPFGLRFEPGSRVPLHCTAMGKLLLSFTPAAQRQKLLKVLPLDRYTEQTITDPVLLEEECERIRKSEVSTDNQEFLAGVICVAAPVRLRNGNAIAAVATSAPVARVSMKRALQFVPLLRSAAAQMALTLEDEPLPKPEAKKRKRSGGAR